MLSCASYGSSAEEVDLLITASIILLLSVSAACGAMLMQNTAVYCRTLAILLAAAVPDQVMQTRKRCKTHRLTCGPGIFWLL